MLTLVVDDDPAIRAYVQTILNSQDFETLEAEDGEQALHIVRMLDGGVDLIITDVQMPGGDGIAFAQAVRATFPLVSIILMSGYAQADADFEFIEKPFSWATMQNVVRQVVAKSPRVS